MLGAWDDYGAGGGAIELGQGLRYVSSEDVVLKESPPGVWGGVIPGAEEGHFGSGMD